MTTDARHVEYMALPDIERAERNPKAHDDALIGESIGRFGFIETPVLDERTGRLVAGHGRTDDLARRFEQGQQPPDGIEVRDGVWFVPVLRGWSSRSDDEALAAGIALNRTGEAGGWDYAELLPILEEFSARSDDDHDLLLGLGFDADDLSRIVADLEADKRGGGDTEAVEREMILVPDDGQQVTVRGDVWLVGPHRVMCGDCREADDVAALLGGAAVAVAFTSPPYAEQRAYDAASGFEPIPPAEYVSWFTPVAANVAAHLADDGSWFVNIKPTVTPDSLGTELYVLDLVLTHAREWGWRFATEFCWERGGVPKRVRWRFKNQFEPVYQFVRGPWKIRPDNVRYPSDSVPIPAGPGIGASLQDERQGLPGSAGGLVLGAASKWAQKRAESAYDYPPEGNYPANQGTGAPLIAPRSDGAPEADSEAGLAYPGNRLPTFAGTHEATGHGAAFPVGLPAWFVRAYSDRGDAVYDPFLGSGSTVVAAVDEGRVGYGMELSARYVDLAVARIQRAVGAVPVRERDGEAVDLLARCTTTR